jgi:hypothetical protein
MDKKIIISILTSILFSTAIYADVNVNGYIKQNGTYVEPSIRTSPNNTTIDNWSTKGNVNPYTGQAGTKKPY